MDILYPYESAAPVCSLTPGRLPPHCSTRWRMMSADKLDAPSEAHGGVIKSANSGAAGVGMLEGQGALAEPTHMRVLCRAGRRVH